MREGPGFCMEQQPQRLFLFIGITRLLGQVPASGKAGWNGLRGQRGETLCPTPRPSSSFQAATLLQVKPPLPRAPYAQGHR